MASSEERPERRCRFLLSIGLFYVPIHEQKLTISKTEEKAGEVVYLS